MGIDIGKINKYNEIDNKYPEVDLIFTGPKKSLVDRVSGKSLQFTRNSTATYIDANGIMQTAAAGEPRYKYDPLTGEVLGLLVEESRTNRLTNSMPTNTRAGVTNTEVTGLPGVFSTARRFTSAGGETLVIIGSNTNDVKLTYSFYARLGTQGSSAFIRNGTNFFVNFNLATGVATNNGWDIGSENMIDVGNGWWRCSASVTGTGFSGFLFGVATDSGNGVYRDPSGLTSAAGDNIIAGGFQIEEGSFPTSYIPTSGSTVTRDPDIVTFANNNLYDNSRYDIVSDPFGMSAGSNTLTLLPSNSENSVIKRASIFSQNITQTEVNTFADKTDEFWRWRVLGTTFALPNFTTDGQVTVDWGDTTVGILTTGEHIFNDALELNPLGGTDGGAPGIAYTSGGIYHDIGFRLDSGTYFAPAISNDGTLGYKNKVVAVGPAPESMLVDGLNAFYGCSNLNVVDATFGIVNSANSTFYLCGNLKNIPKVNTTGITNFTNFARNCSSLTDFPLLDTSSGTNFNYAWNNCTSLTSFPLLDTSSVIDFDTAWQNCSSLTSFPLINTSSGTNFTRTWQNCSSLTSFPLIDTSSGTNYNSTWKGCSSLTSFPLINTSSGTNFTRTWQNCSTLTSFPLIDTSSCTTFSATWVDCSNLTSFPLIDTSSCTTFSNTWQNCSSLTSFPLLDTSSCTTFNDAWYNCSSLTSFPLIDTSSGTNFINAWVNCSSLTSFPLLDTSSGTTFSSTWQGCTSLTSFPLIDTSSGTNFLNAWYNCSSLTNFPANFFDSWTGTPVNNCFFRTWYLCSSLTATSVENILNSIDTSGRSAPASGVDITIDFNASSGTPNISTAVSNLKGRGWTITLNGVAQ